jgi:hypothetical protein
MQAGYGGRSWSKLRAHRKIDCPSRSTVPAAKSYSAVPACSLSRERMAVEVILPQ